MKLIELTKFVENYSLEYHWIENDVILFIPIWLLGEWSKLLSKYHNEGLKCVMKISYFCFSMKEICDFYNIEIEEVFEKEK